MGKVRTANALDVTRLARQNLPSKLADDEATVRSALTLANTRTRSRIIIRY